MLGNHPDLTLRRDQALTLSMLLIRRMLLCTDGCRTGRWKVAIVVINVKRMTLVLAVLSKEILTLFGRLVLLAR